MPEALKQNRNLPAYYLMGQDNAFSRPAKLACFHTEEDAVNAMSLVVAGCISSLPGTDTEYRCNGMACVITSAYDETEDDARCVFIAEASPEPEWLRFLREREKCRTEGKPVPADGWIIPDLSDPVFAASVEARRLHSSLEKYKECGVIRKSGSVSVSE